MSETPTRKEDIFFRYFTRHQNEIYSYLLTLMPNSADAEDVFQETSAVMWRKFDQFEPGTDFAAWGCKIAFYIVLEHRRKKKRSRIYYSMEAIELLSASFEKNRCGRDERIKHLNHCLAKLSDKDKLLIKLRYRTACSIKEIAKQFDKSISVIYKSFTRIHYFLFECIRHGIASEK